MMTEDWSECADSDDDMRETACKAKVADRISIAMFVLHVFNTVSFCIKVFLADVDIDDSESELPFFLKIELPVRISTLRTYKLLLSVQFVNLLFIVIGTGMVNALLITLVRNPMTAHYIYLHTKKYYLILSEILSYMVSRLLLNAKRKISS